MSSLINLKSIGHIEGLYSPHISDKDIILIPEGWTLEKLARAKMNDGINIRNSTKGDRNRNIEKSIEYYRYALGILASDHPAESMKIRARILINLGNAYCDPIRGHKPDEIRLAICAYHLALAVFAKDTDPIDWAKAKMNLGAAYGEYTVGNRQDNIEKSIDVLKQSLEILAYGKWPVDWANALMNLGVAYIDRFKGDRSSNILEAIKCLRQTWRVWRRKKHPHRWAIVMINLGNAHLSRNFDNRLNSIEAAIKSYNQALIELDKNNCAYDWSLAETNLGNAYLDRIKGDSKENIELAINAYKRALKVRTKAKMPLDWAITTMNLGNAYLKGGRIKDAIFALNSALDEISYERMPLEWAKIKAALGKAYSQSVDGDKAANTEISVTEYEEALKAFRPVSSYLCRATAYELGDLYFNNRQWGESARVNKIAVQADKELYQASLLHVSKELQLLETGDLYRRGAYSLAKSTQFEDAVVLLEQGRARILGDVLARDKADLENVRKKNPELYKEYIETSRLIRNLESKSNALNIGSISENIWVQAEKLHIHLNEIIASIRCICGYENFLKEPNRVDLIEAVVNEQPFIYLIATSHGGLALIIYHSKNSDGIDNVTAKSIWIGEFTILYLDGLLNKKSDGNDPMGLFAAYRSFWIENSIDIERWLVSLEWVTGELWHKVMGPIISFLKSIQIEEAFLIPFGLMALLPLHAAWVEEEGKKSYALDHIAFSYAPSARSIVIARRFMENNCVNRFLAIRDTGLEKSQEEVESITKHFEGTSVSVAIQEDVTRDEAIELLSKAQIVHFSCHGDAVLDKPTESSLLMAGGEDLTVKDILDSSLTTARLATLSACETGIIGARLPDEVVSLPTAFIRAGFAGVVAPLWDVIEDDAARIMERFYYFWIKNGLRPAQALRAAQIFVRNNRNYKDYFDWAAFYLTGI